MSGKTALVVATREALDVSTARAVGTCALAISILLLIAGLIVVVVALLGAFVNPLLFLLGLSLIIVAFIPTE